MHAESLPASDAPGHRYCSMCGPKLCSMKTSGEVRRMERPETTKPAKTDR